MSRKLKKAPLLVIARATAEQIEAIAAIERACFSDPWSAESFTSLCEQGAPWIFLSARMDREICGYAVASAVCDEGEIANIAVAPAWQRQGVGTMLLIATLRELMLQGAESVYLEVRASNTAARRLYERRGFEVTGIRRGYYTLPREDAIVMRRALPPLSPQRHMKKTERKENKETT